MRLGFLHRPGIEQTKQEAPGIITAEETKPPLKYDIPVAVQAPYHQPHLENLFNTIKGQARLNCPADTAFVATVVALKINEAVEKRMTLTFDGGHVRRLSGSRTGAFPSGGSAAQD